MAYLFVKDFKLGMDRRRPKTTGVPGSLWVGKNVHITRGGDIENAKKFVPVYAVPGTVGMATAQGQIFVFGSAAAVTVPAGVQYQRLQAGAATLVRVLDAKPFAGKLYVIGEFDDGTIYHFYDGTRVSAWDTVSDANATFAVLADYLADRINNETAVEANAFGNSIVISSRVPGTAFTITSSTLDGGGTDDQTINLTPVQANQPAVDEALATATITITGGTAGSLNKIIGATINGTSLMDTEVLWATSNTETATALAGAINLAQATHNYSAIAVGTTVTISAPSGTGATPNGYATFAYASGDVTFTTTNMAGGAAATAALAQIYRADFAGTFQATDKFTLTINGVPYYGTPRGAAAGASSYVRDKRVFSAAASLLRFSKLNDPANWTDTNVNSGAGFISVSSDTQGYERVIGAASYNDLTAVFSRQNINLYRLGADAEQFGLDRQLENTGTRAERSIKAYGNNEVFYLDDSGIRSVRARQGTDTPYAADVGSAIDDFVQEHIRSIAYDKVARAVSVIEPKDGRYWLAMDDRIYVLSFFPSNKIQAWTYYEPGFEVSDFARTKDRVYARAGDTIYLYGGVDGNTWPDDDEIECVVETPYLSGETPATLKALAGADFDLSNVWEVRVYPDPNRLEHYDALGKISKNTGSQAHIALPGLEATWAMKFICNKGGRATISSFSIHYKPNEAR